MTRTKIWNNSLKLLLLLTLVSAILLIPCIFLVGEVKAQETTTVKIVPAERTVGEELAPLPTAPFTYNITVSNVTDLFAWQIQIYYFPSILNWTSAIYPAGHVFEGEDFFAVEGLQENATNTLSNTTAVDTTNPLTTKWKWGAYEYTLTDWRDRDNSGDLTTSDIVWLTRPGVPPYYNVKAINLVGSSLKLTAEVAYVKFGATLVTGQPYSGTGTAPLAQLTFTGIGPGVTPLNFSEPLGAHTFLLNSQPSPDDEIAFSTENSELTVLGVVPAGRESSTITLDVDPAAVQVGSDVTVSGAITPSKPNVNVTISYKLGDGAWTTLQTVTTDSNSEYTYTWTTNATGTYKLRAEWLGDEDHLPAKSAEKTVTVSEEPPPAPTDYYIYIAIGIGIIIVVVVVVVYFLRKR